MPDIRAFRGWRYDLGHVGELGDVVAPPYDVISSAQRDLLYKRHACNCIRLILNREEPGDDEQGRYERAAGFLRAWKQEGVIAEEGEPCLYVYHQQFTVDGREYHRRGVMARVRLERFGEGSIYPHEETLPGPKADRLRLMRATGFNLSPIFGLYPDDDDAVGSLLDEAVSGKTPLAATDDLGVVHRLWPVSGQATVSAAKGLLGPKPVYIADGHHRYETAVAYRDELQAAGKLKRDDAAANFVLMMLVGMRDPGLVILPTHRLVRGLAELDAPWLADLLAENFALETIGRGAEACRETWERIEMEGAQDALGFGTTADGVWQLARLKDPAVMNELVPDHGPAWRGLGVSILHELAVKHRLVPGLGGLEPEFRYVHQLDEVNEAVSGRTCQLACLVPPATIDHIREIAGASERMPPKSTYFYPKLLSGLVFNPLRM